MTDPPSLRSGAASLVERLRERAAHYSGDTPWQSTIRQDCTEAADEIERLRAALRKICEPITVAADPDSVSACQDLHELICATARAALGEVKDD